jgi:sigma-B regulation protein RsbU (phosphoserine phosphatase)
MYGEERLQADLARIVDEAPQEVVDAIHAAVDEFADGAEQSDDITMLFFRYVGAPVAVQP